MADNIPYLFDPIAISRAESLGLNAWFIVEGYMAGEHKSPYRGFAIEFAQQRDYTDGEPLIASRRQRVADPPRLPEAG